MLVQFRRDGRLRLFRQHHHALLAGELASTWSGIGREPAPLPFDLVLAVGLHDLSWRELDRVPTWNGETGRPAAFHELPVDEKVAAYLDGLDTVERIHPYSALLGSLHYTSFPDVRDVASLQEPEAKRQERLREELRLGEAEESRLDRHLAYLQFFDALSIFLCLSPPSATTEGQPRWVDEVRHLDTPEGEHVHLTWWDDDVIHVDPFPFRESLEVSLPYREIEGSVDGAEALAEAWEAAATEAWWLCLQQPPRLA